MLAVADGGGEKGQKLADIICERSLIYIDSDVGTRNT